MKTYYTIKLKTCGTVHICYKKQINGEMYYVASNHFNKWKCTNSKIQLLN